MYYALGGTEDPHRWIDDEPFIQGVKLRHGVTVTQELPILEFTLQPYEEYSADDAQFIPAFFPSAPLLFRDDLIQALSDFGVTNFDAYDATITDPDDEKVYTNYKVINLIGLIAAADMEKSDAVVHDNIPLIDVDFDRLVIDEEKTDGVLMFRLAESMSTVLVHEKLRDYLIAKGFGDDMHFWDPEEIAL